MDAIEQVIFCIRFHSTVTAKPSAGCQYCVVRKEDTYIHWTHLHRAKAGIPDGHTNPRYRYVVQEPNRHVDLTGFVLSQREPTVTVRFAAQPISSDDSASRSRQCSRSCI